MINTGSIGLNTCEVFPKKKEMTPISPPLLF